MLIDCVNINLKSILMNMYKMNIVANLMRLENDIEFGLAQEEPVLNNLRQFFHDDTIYKTGEKFCKYDGGSIANPEIIYEIKSRRNTKNAYPTTIIPVHKCVMLGDDKRLIIVFHFTDKLCYIEYDNEKFQNYRIQSICAIRSGGNPSVVAHFHIPVADLLDIDL